MNNTSENIEMDFSKRDDNIPSNLDLSKVTKKVRVAGGIITRINDQKDFEVLLIQRAKNDHFPLLWEFPRGKVEPKETVFQGLVREVKEECGLDVYPHKFIDKFYYVADEGTRLSIQYNYLCKVKDKNQKVKLSKEHDNFKWVQTYGEIQMVCMPEIQKTLLKIIPKDKQNVAVQNEKDIIAEYLCYLKETIQNG